MTKPIISLQEARDIASEWHGGQRSPLYSFCSTGRVCLPVDDYQREIEDCFAEASSKEASRLTALLLFLVNESNGGIQ